MPSWIGYLAVGLIGFWVGAVGIAIFASAAIGRLNETIDRQRRLLHLWGEE